LYEAPEIGLKASPTPIDVKHATTTPPGTDKRVDGEVLEFEELASPYVYKRGFLHTTYRMRKVGDKFMIDESPVDVDVNSNIHIRKKEFRGNKGLWELLTRKRVEKKLISTDDLQQYKRILELTNTYLEGYDRDANINVTTGLKIKEFISK
jgi:hypothetical protein